MKRFFSLSAIVSVIFSMCITSCKKDDAPPSKTQLITSKSWMENKIELTYAGTTTDATDFFLDDCQKDNLVTFTKDGSYSFNTGTDDCSGDEPSEKGSWSFKNNETILNISAPSDTVDLTLVAISSSALKVSIKLTDFDINGDGIDDDVTEAVTFGAK